ncbi:MAG: ABC transporter permease subunit [Clostridiales bacterium]|nr:ABC transporter permease subunit [Clostridiales bacterium]
MNRARDLTIYRPKLKIMSLTDYTIYSIIIIFFLTTIYTVFFRIEFRWEFFQAETAMNIARNFLRFDLVENVKRIEMIRSLLNTLALAFLTTLSGYFIGLILGLFAARNLTNGKIASAIRGAASFVRAVPTIIWVLILVSGYGLTATTAVVGMFFHTLSFFIKSFAEAFEEIDGGTIEALKATGSNWLQIVFAAVLPSSLTKMISWVAIRSEINFAVAVVIGPAVGVPGTIGTMINNAARAGNHAEQGFGVILIFVTALIMEVSINYFRQKSIID